LYDGNEDNKKAEGVENMVSETNKNLGDKNEPDLRGTFASVMFVLAFIVISWFGVLGIFLSR